MTIHDRCLLKRDLFGRYVTITMVIPGPYYVTEVYSPTNDRIFSQSIPWSVDDTPEEKEELKNYVLYFHDKLVQVIGSIVNEDWLYGLSVQRIEESWRYEKIYILIKQLHELIKATEKALHLCAIYDDKDPSEILGVAFDHFYSGIVILKRLFGINLMENLYVETNSSETEGVAKG